MLWTLVHAFGLHLDLWPSAGNSPPKKPNDRYPYLQFY